MNYAPLYFASAVLPDGRVIVEGGEYNNGVEDRTTKGAIYDPVKDIWTRAMPLYLWTTIGDAESVVLPDGTFMLANCCAKEAALLDATTLTWKILTPANGYFGKYDSNNEEGWTLLPNGKVLTIDTYIGVNDPRGTNSEVYDPATGSWSSAGSTVAQLWDSRAASKTRMPRRLGERNRQCCVTCPTERSSRPARTPVWIRIATALPATPRSMTRQAEPGRRVRTSRRTITMSPTVLQRFCQTGTCSSIPNPGYGNSPSTLYEFDGTQLYLDDSSTKWPQSQQHGGQLVCLITAAGTVLLTPLSLS